MAAKSTMWGRRSSRLAFRLAAASIAGPAHSICLLLLLAPAAIAQRATGEIRLEVRDPSGAPMDASGLLESLAAGIDRRFETTPQGRHTFASLPFGGYRLVVERSGFASQSLLIEVRSEVPLSRVVTLPLTPVSGTVEVRESATLLNPAATGAVQHLGADFLKYRRSSTPGRSVLDLVNMQPGWLLEANGVLHPRGSEYDTQYVIDGIPLYDNRSPSFAQALGVDEFETLTVRTANYPAEFGRKMGGVIEVNTERDARRGWHGRSGWQGGSFAQRSGFATVQHARGRDNVGLSGEGMITDRYLDPPVLQNYTNRGSGGGVSGRWNRQWSAGDSTRLYAHSRRAGFLVPNELLQQRAGQRQDRTAAETLGQAAHTHLFSPTVMLQAQAMLRDTSARLWGNALSTPILPDQDRGFREGYAGGSVSWARGAHEFKAGADALFTSIRENFGFRVIARRIGDTQVIDGDVPAVFRLAQARQGREQSFFVQDAWRRGRLTLSAGLRFDHYRLVAGETAWSPRLGVAYHFDRAGLVLRASYDRIFQGPAVENLLLASSDLVEQLGGEGAFLPLRPARGNFAEAGFSKRLLGRFRLDGTWYTRRVENFADDAVLFNTGVSFPIAFRQAGIHGYEAKLEVPRWSIFSGFVSFANMSGTGYLPVAGGLFLGDDAEEVLTAKGSFPITQDQRNTFRSRVRVEPHRRAWFAFGAAYNSGLPFEIEGPADLDFVRAQYGPRILSKVNFERGRVRPSASLDLSAGWILREAESANIRLQADVFNLADRLNLINFSGVLSGTALEAGRNFAVRLNIGF